MESEKNRVNVFDNESHAAPEKRIASAFERISQVFRHQQWELFNSHGLRPIQTRLLIHLKNQTGEPQTVTSIAHFFNLAKATISNTIKTLERDGYIQFKQDPDDGRRKIVQLTEEGEKMAHKSSGFAHPVFEAVQTLPDHEKGQLLQHLLKTIYHLQDKDLLKSTRMCFACKHLKQNPHRYIPFHCEYFQQPMKSTDLKIDCPKFEPAED